MHSHDASAPTPSLTRDDFRQFFQQACTPERDWKIGTEHELFVFDVLTNKPIPFEGDVSISALMEEMQAFGWQLEKGSKNTSGHSMAMKRDGASLTLEPAGQFELSGAPLDTLHETAQEFTTHFKELKQAGEKIGVGFLPLGFHPTATLGGMPRMPKKRYELMRKHMPKVGERGCDIMYRSCTVQVNLDYSSEADMARKMRVGMALQPVAIALWANSPYLEGQQTDYLSFRSHCWTKTDDDRAGFLPQVMNAHFGFDDYIDFALGAPMCVAKRDGDILGASGLSFSRFMAGELPILPGEKATMDDWQDHLATLFPEVRLKKIVEMRGSDCAGPDMLMALPAFWVGLLYHENTLETANAWVKNWHPDDILSLYEQARATGLKGEGINGTTIKTLAAQTLDMALNGLKARGLGEEQYLAPLQEIVQTGKTPADRLIETVQNHPTNDPACLFEKYRI